MAAELVQDYNSAEYGASKLLDRIPREITKLPIPYMQISEFTYKM